jgi:hypothetical protein
MLDRPWPGKKIEDYRKPKDDRVAEHTDHGPDDTLTSTALPEFTLSLDAFFAK